MEVENAKPEPMAIVAEAAEEKPPAVQNVMGNSNGILKQEDAPLELRKEGAMLPEAQADGLPPLREQKLPLPKDIRKMKAQAKHVVVISFGSFGIRYGFAVDSTPKSVFPAVAFPRHPDIVSDPSKTPLRIPAHSLRSKEEADEARKQFEETRDAVADELTLHDRRRGGGRPIPWRAVVEPVASETLKGSQYTAEAKKNVQVPPPGKIIVGHEVESIIRDEARARKYDIIFPIWDGKLLFECGAPHSLVRKALDCILDHIVEELSRVGNKNASTRSDRVRDEKVNGDADRDAVDSGEDTVPFGSSNEAKTFVALVMPETSQRRDTAEIVDAIFRTRSFQTAAVFIHQSAVSCAFGAGLATCAVVDIGHSATTVACVEDGLICGESRVRLNYGSWHIQSTLDLLLTDNSNLDQVLSTEPGPDGNPLTPQQLQEDREAAIPKIAEQTGSFNVDGNDTLGVALFKLPSGRGLRLRLGVGFRTLPSYGLIYPKLLGTASEVVRKRKNIPRRGLFEMNADDDNFGTDIFNDVRRSGIATAALPIGTFANDFGQAAAATVDADRASIVDAIIWSVAKAVELKRPDQQSRTAEHYRRYLNAIVLAGGGASIDGIALALEARIKKGFLDAGLTVADVTVIDGGKGKGDEELAAAAAMLKEAGADGGIVDDTDTASLPWKGGAVMVEADAVRDYWIYRDDWEARNVRALRERAPFYW